VVPLDHPAGVPASADLETVYIGYESADLFDHLNEPLAHLFVPLLGCQDPSYRSCPGDLIQPGGSGLLRAKSTNLATAAL
jgi:hypothetical protein